MWLALWRWRMHVYMSMCVHTAGAERVTWDAFFCHSSLYFLRQSFTEPRNCWLAHRYLHLCPQLWDYRLTLLHRLLKGLLGSKSGSSSSHDKCLTDWATSPVHSLNFEYWPIIFEALKKIILDLFCRFFGSFPHRHLQIETCLAFTLISFSCLIA